jgi:hypothetical protein
MNNSVVNPRIDVSEWEPKFPFDLVVAYEDTLTRTRALRLYDHLAQQLLNDYDFQCSWWKFEHLTNPLLRNQSADAAADANMVILSLRAQQDISPLHQNWIEEWLPRRDSRKSALVALVAGGNEPGHDKSPMITYLQNAARLGRMDFFTHSFDLNPSQPDLSARQIIQQVQVTPNHLHETLQRPMPTPRWGINE